MTPETDHDRPHAAADAPPGPSARAIAAALAGMAAAWLAAGSTGLLADPLRHALTWVALAVALIACWPPRQTWRERLILAATLVVAVVMMMPALPVYNVLAVALVLAMVARASAGLERRLLLITGLAVAVLGVYLLASTSIATVWSVAHALGRLLGAVAERVSGRPLWVGATFGGLDFLVLMAALYVGWLVSTAPPRLPRAVYAGVAILGGHLVYLVLLSYSADLYDALPPAPPPPEFRDYIPPPWSWSDAARTLLPWNMPLLAGVIQVAVAAVMFRWAAWLPAAQGDVEQTEGKEDETSQGKPEQEKRKQGRRKQDKREQDKREKGKREQGERQQGGKTDQPVPSTDSLLGAGLLTPPFVARSGDRPQQRGDRPQQWLGNAITWGPAILAVFVPLLITLAPGQSSLAGKKIVAYDVGYLDWEKPVHDRFGEASAGMYGMLPEFVTSLGGRFERSAELSQGDIEGADVLLLIHPVGPWPEDRLDRVRELVRRGGSLLVLAETPVQEGEVASSYNDVLQQVLEPAGMEVRFDAATSATWNWQYSCTAIAHPAVTGIDDLRNRFGMMSGPSIRLRWPARPILLGRWGWSDPGIDSALTRAYRYEAGEELGDLVLAAEQRLGRGTVVVLSDAASFRNQGNVQGYVFTGRLLAYLAGAAANPQAAWRQTLGLLGCLALVGLMAWPLVPARVATVAVVVALALAGSRTFSRLSTRVLPDGRQHSPQNNVAYIDASHVEAYADTGWGFEGLAGLALTLMRNGYQPFLLPELTGERLQRAGMLISIGPSRPFSSGERAVVRRFVENGGIFICMAGAEHAGPIQPLLDQFNLRVPRSPVRPGEKDREPTPMGHFTTLYRPEGADYDAGLLFYTGWPVEGDGADQLVRGFDSLPLIVRRKVGRGHVVLIGDTAFAMNKNLEYVGGEPFNGRYDNAHFWRWLITNLTGQETWLPPRKERTDGAVGSRQ